MQLRWILWASGSITGASDTGENVHVTSIRGAFVTYDPAPPDSKASLSDIAAVMNFTVAGVGTILIGTKVDDQEHCLLLDDVLHVPDAKIVFFH